MPGCGVQQIDWIDIYYAVFIFKILFHISPYIFPILDDDVVTVYPSRLDSNYNSMFQYWEKQANESKTQVDLSKLCR